MISSIKLTTMLISLLSLLSFFSLYSSAESNSFTKTTLPHPLIKSQQSWDGGNISYPKGPAEITSYKLTLLPNSPTEYHCHPVPTFGYVLKGTIVVETDSGESISFKEGQAVIEVMGTIHRGKAINGPAEILVFYAGTPTIPNTVLAKNDTEHIYCK